MYAKIIQGIFNAIPLFPTGFGRKIPGSIQYI